MLMGLLTYAVSEYRKLSLSPFTEVDVLFVNIKAFIHHVATNSPTTLLPRVL